MTPSTGMRKLLIVLASVICVSYLAYRAIYTLNLSGIYAPIASIALYVAELYGIFNLFLFFLQVWEVDEPPVQPVLEGRTVDVFVPTYNEDVSLLRATLEACVRLDYPHRTHVLDDGKRPEVETLARELGINYISRPDNRHFKAGNLNYAFERTDGEFVVILDADHVPEPHFITRLIGYFRDERLGYVQTPHAFYNFDSFQARLDHKNRKYWEEGHLFYYVIQPGRNHWGCPIFAGSAAMFRRNALKEVGYIATETITEDMHTGLRMNSRGWSSLAISERLVAGQAAPDITTFHAQRLRWGTGNLSIMKFDNPLFIKGLSLPQRLCYLGSMLHWSSGIFKLIIYLTPIAMLFSGIPPVKEFTPTLLVLTVIYLFVSIFTMKLVSNGYGSIINSELFSMVNFWTQIKSTFRAAIGYGSRIFNVTPKGAAAVRSRQQKSVWPYIRPQTYLIILSVLALFWGWGRLLFDGTALLGKYPAIAEWPLIGAPIAWLLRNIPNFGFGISDDYFKPVVPTIWVLIHFWLAYKVTQRAFWPADRRFTTRHVVHVPVEYEIAGANVAPRYGVTVDLNDTGMAFVAYERFNIGDSLKFVVRGAGEVIKCKGEIRTSTDLTRGTAAEGFRYGVQFLNLTPPQVDALNRICLHYGVPRMYQQYEKNKGGVFGAIQRATSRGAGQRRIENRNVYHLPVIINTGTTEETAQFSATEDVSRAAMAALFDHDLPKNSQVGYMMSTPLGDIRGTARVLRSNPETFGGKIYHRCVMEFSEFEGQGRTTLQSLINPGEAKPLTSALKPDRKPILVRMAGPTLIAIVIAIPLIIAQQGVFTFYHKDDFVLREINRKKVHTTADENEVNRIFAVTMAQSNPSNDRLVLLMESLKVFNRQQQQLEVAEILANRAPNNPSLQSTLIYAQLRAAQKSPEQFAMAEATYEKLLMRQADLKPQEIPLLKLAGARVAEQRGNSQTLALDRYAELYRDYPNMIPEPNTPNPISLRQEYGGVLIKAGKYDEAKKVLEKVAPNDGEGRKLLVAAYLLQAREFAADKTNPNGIKKAEDEQNSAAIVAEELAREAERRSSKDLASIADRMKADITMAKNEWQNAHEIVKKMIDAAGGDINKVDVEVRRRMAQAQLGIKDYAGAMAGFSGLIEQDYINDDVVKGFLDTASNKEEVKTLGDREKRIILQIYERNQRKPLEDPIYLARLGWVLQRVKEFEKSTIVLEKANTMLPKDANDRAAIRNQLADILIESDNLERAAQIMGQSNAFKAKETLAYLYMKRGDVKRAETELKSLITTYPIGFKSDDGTAVSPADILRNEKLLANVQVWGATKAPVETKKVAFEEAIGTYSKLSKKYPEDKEIAGAAAQAQLWYADITKNASDFSEAVKRYAAIVGKKAYVFDKDNKDNPANRAVVEAGFIDAAAQAPKNSLDAEQTALFRELASVKLKTADESVTNLSRLAWVLTNKTNSVDARKDAADLLKKAVATNPKDEAIIRELAGSLAAAEQYTDAADILTRLKKGNDDRMRLAEIYSGGRQWKLATQELQEILDDKNAKPDELKKAREMSAYVISWSGEHKKSIKMMDEILAVDAGNSKIRQHRADVTLWDKDYDGALEQYLTLVKQFPNDSAIVNGFTNAAAKSKRALKDDELSVVRRLTDLVSMPDNTDALLLARLADVYQTKLNDPVKANQLGLKAFRLNPKDNVVRKEVGYILGGKDLKLFREADSMLQGLELKGDERKLYVSIAVQAENFDAARRQARLYLMEQMPNTTEEKAARRLLADVLTWKGDYEESLAIYERLLADSKGDRSLKVDIAEVHRFWQNYPAALTKYAELLSEEFENLQLWIGFIDAASSAPEPLVRKQRDLLVKVHDRYSKDLTDPRRLSRLAWVMLRLSENDKANALLTKAVASDPKQPAVRKELAGVLAAADRRAEAIEMLRPEYVYSTLDIKEILNLTDLLTAESQLDKAEKELSKIVNEKSEKAYRVRYASVLLWNGNYVKAREVLGKLQRDFPEDFEVKLRLAQTYLWDSKERDYTSALGKYTDLLAFKRNPMTPEDPMANPEVWSGFIDSASGMVGESLREFPRKNIGPILTTGQKDGILKAYEFINTVQARVVTSNREEMDKFLALGGEKDMGYETRKKALENKQFNRLKSLAESSGRLGLLLGLLGDGDRSRGAFGAALAVDKTNRDVWLQYAQTLTAIGDDAKAKTIFDWLLSTQTSQTLPTPGELLAPKTLR
jgi:cellulose synthase/poly-beta-1,6-N-acetylglucosamine synthase-like glycosyltransferase